MLQGHGFQTKLLYRCHDLKMPLTVDEDEGRMGAVAALGSVLLASVDLFADALCPVRPQYHPLRIHDPADRAERVVGLDHRQGHKFNSVVKFAVSQKARHERIDFLATILDVPGLE